MITGLRFRYPDHLIEPGRTLIFLDEIQECSEAVTSLKFWSESRQYDVIASGSLLGIDYKRPSSYPVGYIEYLRMYGLDFEEFLWSMNISESMISSVHDYFIQQKAVPETVHHSLMKMMRQYIAIGGMPEAVAEFVETNDYRQVDRIQREILQGYLYDIAHYASADEKKVKAEKCYLSLSKQLLGKENHKFQYKEVEKGGRAQKYYSSIDWLTRADVVQLCNLVTKVEYDLEDYAREDFFRAYPTDLSLLIAMKDFALKQHIVENTLEGKTKGGIYECAIADILYKKGYNLYFYKNETTKQEIDFLYQKNGNVIPVEVKSGNKTAVSLNRLLKSHSEITEAYKVADSNVGKGENVCLTIPLYMTMFL